MVPSLSVALRMLLLIRTAGAMYSIIADCDEGRLLYSAQVLELELIRSVQLLRAVALFPAQHWFPDLGAFPGIRRTKLGLYPASLASGRSWAVLATPGQGEFFCRIRVSRADSSVNNSSPSVSSSASSVRLPRPASTAESLTASTSGSDDTFCSACFSLRACGALAPVSLPRTSHSLS